MYRVLKKDIAEKATPQQYGGSSPRPIDKILKKKNYARK